MLRMTTREPSPFTGCRFEMEAAAPDEPLCAYCQSVEVAEEGEHCSALCAELSANEAEADRQLNAQREAGVLL